MLAAACLASLGCLVLAVYPLAVGVSGQGTLVGRGPGPAANGPGQVQSAEGRSLPPAHGAPLATETPTSTPEGPAVYEGIYGAMFEVSEFVTGTLRCPGHGAGWWLVPNEEFWDRFKALYPDPHPFPPPIPDMVFTRFRGLLSPPGRFGHLGAYEHEVRVVELLAMVKIEACPPLDLTPPPIAASATPTGRQPSPSPSPTMSLTPPRPTATPGWLLLLPVAEK